MTTDQSQPTATVPSAGTDGGPPLARRSVLAAGGLVAGGASLLAACGAGSTGSAGSSSTAVAPSPAPASGGELARLSAIPVGTAVAATLAGAPVVVAQPTAGEAVAFSAVCTHMGCTVAPAGAKLECPCHGSVYDALTGKVLSGPAPRALPAVPVTVKDGAVVAGGA